MDAMEEKKPERKSNAGRKPRSYKVNLTEEQYKQIGVMSGIGLTLPQIAALIGVNYRTLDRMLVRDPKLKDVVDQGRANAIAKVSQTAYKMAASGKNSDMTKFYLRCRAGWSEKIEIDANVKHEIKFATKIGDDGVLRIESDEKDILDTEALDL